MIDWADRLIIFHFIRLRWIRLLNNKTGQSRMTGPLMRYDLGED